MKQFDLGENWNGARSKIFISDNEIVVRDEMDAQPIIDANSVMREGNRMGRNGYLAARIPATLYYEWRKDWRVNHADKWTWKTYLASKLNNRDWLKLRTLDAKI